MFFFRNTETLFPWRCMGILLGAIERDQETGLDGLGPLKRDQQQQQQQPRSLSAGWHPAKPKAGSYGRYHPLWFHQVVVLNIFGIFTPILGEKIPIWLAHIFQMGWFNHQPDSYLWSFGAMERGIQASGSFNYWLVSNGACGISLLVLNLFLNILQNV